MLLIAAVAQVVTSTSATAVTAGRRHHTLAHELAVDSALMVLAQRLLDDQPLGLARELDQRGLASLSFKVGDVQVDCAVRDDAAKLNPNILRRPDQKPALERKLKQLAGRCSLPQARVELQPLPPPSAGASGTAYRWFDQLFSQAGPGMWLTWDLGESQAVWSDVLTFWGDGRVDLRRVDEAVLDAALEDLQPGLARKILAARLTDRTKDFFTQAALISVNAEVRQKVAARLGYDLHRYALRLDTSIGADRRRWFVVLRASENNWEVLQRSQIQW